MLINRQFAARFCGLVLSVLLAACTTNKESSAVSILQAELEQRELALQEEQEAFHIKQAELDERVVAMEAEKKRNKQLQQRLRQQERALRKAKPQVKKSEEPSAKGRAVELLAGATEDVRLTPPDVVLNARMDTGAKRCILGVTYMAEFERDGEPHVRFNIIPEEGAKKIEVTQPIKEHIRFKELNSSSKKRPVVQLRVALGNIDEQVEFVLIEDKKAKVSTVHIGRNFLRDLVVVDVGKNTLIKPQVK